MRSRLPSTSKEPPGGAHALRDALQAFGVIAHRHASVSAPISCPVHAVRLLDHDRDAEACDAIVAGLAAWFGDEQGIRDRAAAVRAGEGLVVADDDGIVGFLTWEAHRPAAAEITWMAVRADARRRGVGRLLLV